MQPALDFGECAGKPRGESVGRSGPQTATRLLGSNGAFAELGLPRQTAERLWVLVVSVQHGKGAGVPWPCWLSTSGQERAGSFPVPGCVPCH